MQTGKVVMRVMAGFLGAFGATVVLGSIVLGVLTALWPEWQVAWMMSGTKERVLWIAVPSIALCIAVTAVLWRKSHRSIAIGVVLFAITDLVVGTF